MLRDRLVVGINDENIQKRLLSVEYSKLTFNKALEIATALEEANTSGKVLQQNLAEPASDVNRVETSQRKPVVAKRFVTIAVVNMITLQV